MTKASEAIAIKDQVAFVREDLDSTVVTLNEIKNGTSEECGEAQREFFISDLQSKVDMLEAIEQNLLKLERIMDVAGSELAAINALKHVGRIARATSSVPVEEYPVDTEVLVERNNGSKTEFVDATIIGYSEGRPCVVTYFGAVWSLLDPAKVRRKEVAHV